MEQLVVPVRFPLSSQSRATLAAGIDLAEEADANLTVLHVNLYHGSRQVGRAELKRAVEREFGRIDRARFVVRSGALVEETILDEVAAQDADVVVIGERQLGRWRSMLRRLVDDPNVERYLTDALDCEVRTVAAE